MALTPSIWFDKESRASPLPTLDSTRLLGHAALDVTLGKAHLPNWRGRPHVERFR